MSHQRRFDTAQKFYINVATAVVIGLIGWQANISLKNNEEQIKLNKTMTYMIDEVSDVKANQKSFRKTFIDKVSAIERKVSRICDRQNTKWVDNKIPCE